MRCSSSYNQFISLIYISFLATLPSMVVAKWVCPDGQAVHRTYIEHTPSPGPTCGKWQGIFISDSVSKAAIGTEPLRLVKRGGEALVKWVCQRILPCSYMLWASDPLGVFCYQEQKWNSKNSQHPDVARSLRERNGNSVIFTLDKLYACV